MYSIYSLTFKPTCQIQLCPNWFFCVILARTYGLLYCIYVISIVTQYYGMAVPGPVELLVYLKLSALWDISGTMSNELGNPNITYCELCTAGYYRSGTNNTNVTGPCLTIAISVLFHESLSLNVFSYVLCCCKIFIWKLCLWIANNVLSLDMWLFAGPCDAGYYCPAGQSEPSPMEYNCTVGHHCPVGTPDSYKCAAGYYQDEELQSDCKDCPVGRWDYILLTRGRLIQGQSFEGGTFQGQLVQWSVRIIRELPSSSFWKENEDNFFHNLVVYLSQSHSLNCDQSESVLICQWHL